MEECSRYCVHQDVVVPDGRLLDKGRLYLSHELGLGRLGRSVQGVRSSDRQQRIAAREVLGGDLSTLVRTREREADQLAMERSHRFITVPSEVAAGAGSQEVQRSWAPSGRR